VLLRNITPPQVSRPISLSAEHRRAQKRSMSVMLRPEAKLAYRAKTNASNCRVLTVGQRKDADIGCWSRRRSEDSLFKERNGHRLIPFLMNCFSPCVPERFPTLCCRASKPGGSLSRQPDGPNLYTLVDPCSAIEQSAVLGVHSFVNHFASFGRGSHNSFSKRLCPGRMSSKAARR
jgi:hypothetical protein